MLPVTHLQSFVLCERRYQYAHVVGLAEFPIHFEVDAEPELEPLLPGRTRSPNDPRARGTLVVFQRYVPERFAWRTLARRRTDATGLARISVRAVRRVRLCAVVRTGGSEIASRTVRIGSRPSFG